MVDYGIKDKIALVTGASGDGLGRADAVALAACGVKVAVMDVKSGAETVEIITRAGGIAKDYTADISKSDQVDACVNQIEKDLGPVTILVNNASILSTVGMFLDIPADKFNRDVEVNTIGSVNVTRACWKPCSRLGGS